MLLNRLSGYSDESDRAERGAAVRSQLQEISQEYQSKTIQVAILLEECQREEYWRQDSVTYTEYVESKLGISMRTAQAMTQVIRACKSSNVPMDEISRIGWSKIAVVASSLTPENADTLLKEADAKTCRELRHQVKHNKLFPTNAKPNGKLEKRQKIDIHATFVAALQVACHHTHDLDIERNLKFIADKFIEFCPPPSALPSINYRN